eukprot:TRINITY_DN2273_c1_g1_i1.p1 TRINITY_DN2273_c1_g1~~TRINITY_DN2273_c1_g1_i1.p1  ORF type:complete len:156 (+),score=26.94 TRINITY_DN2273_c1_g1_i1:288-755(+)
MMRPLPVDNERRRQRHRGPTSDVRPRVRRSLVAGWIGAGVSVRPVALLSDAVSVEISAGAFGGKTSPFSSNSNGTIGRDRGGLRLGSISRFHGRFLSSFGSSSVGIFQASAQARCAFSSESSSGRWRRRPRSSGGGGGTGGAPTQLGDTCSSDPH